MAGRRCERQGCRAWARRGERLCASHRTRSKRATAAAEGDGARAAEGVGEGGREPPRRLAAVVGQLEAGEAAGLAGEIAAARLTLARLLREEDDPVRLADGVAKAAGVVLKARQLERQQAAAGENLAGVTARILEEMGLGTGSGE
jgi:hypothetical protein